MDAPGLLRGVDGTSDANGADADELAGVIGLVVGVRLPEVALREVVDVLLAAIGRLVDDLGLHLRPAPLVGRVDEEQRHPLAGIEALAQARLVAGLSQISSPRRSYQMGFIWTLPSEREVPTMAGITSSRNACIGSLRAEYVVAKRIS